MTEANTQATPEYHVSRNGVFQFCATSVQVQGGNVNYVGDCAAPPVPPGRYLSGRVHYPPRETTGNVVDLTLWENLFGRSGTGEPAVAVPFPGISGVNPIINSLPVGGYIAAKFVVPNSDVQGQYKVPPEWGTTDVDMSISTTPGDFNPATALGVAIGPLRANQPYLQYTTQTGGTRIHLVKGATYYFNARRHGTGNMVVAFVHQGGAAV